MQYPLTGYGLSPYKHIPATYTFLGDRADFNRTMDPHNCILEAFLATGIIGGTAFLFILIRGIMDAFICFWYCDEVGWLAIFFLSLSVTMMFEYRVIAPHFWFASIALRTIVISIKDEYITSNNSTI
jgi:hypothetical protein